MTASGNPPPSLLRTALAATLVLAGHVAVLWALENGLLQRSPELLVPVAQVMQVQLPEQEPKPRPVAEPPPSRPAARPAPPAAAPQAQPPKPAPPPAPATPTQTPTVAAAQVPAPAPVPAAPSAALSAAPASPAAPAATSPAAASPAPSPPPANVRPAPAAPAAAPVTPAVPALVGAYCRLGPSPVYPALSKRLEETGRTLHHVHVTPDGRPQKAELVKSSGFARLDAAALDAIMKSRFEIRLEADKTSRSPPTGTVIVPVPFKFQLDDNDSSTPEKNPNESNLRHC